MVCVYVGHTNKNMSLVCKLARNPNATPNVMYTKCAKCAAWSLDGCTYMNVPVFVGMWPLLCVNDDGQMNKINMVVWYGNMWNDDDAGTGYVRLYVIVCWHGAHMNT